MQQAACSTLYQLRNPDYRHCPSFGLLQVLLEISISHGPVVTSMGITRAGSRQCPLWSHTIGYNSGMWQGQLLRQWGHLAPLNAWKEEQAYLVFSPWCPQQIKIPTSVIDSHCKNINKSDCLVWGFSNLSASMWVSIIVRVLLKVLRWNYVTQEWKPSWKKESACKARHSGSWKNESSFVVW